MNKIQVHENICKSLNELYARKNADYGDSFGKSFKEYGLTMACIRLEDKLNRIKALSKHEAQVSDESITDTLMDLANYSIMTLVELARNMAPHDAPISAKGDHCPTCNKECICLTCLRDCDACCIDHHGFGNCPVTKCPDHVREE